MPDEAPQQLPHHAAPRAQIAEIPVTAPARSRRAVIVVSIAGDVRSA
jgi:hypothetical protein